MIKGVTQAHFGPIWYHSEPSDGTSPIQFLGWDFFCRFLQQDGSKSMVFEQIFEIAFLMCCTVLSGPG